ncbi:MAG: hypothetical protein SGI73_10245 [Chloroflexota bacterium]|nr:hypothetical protein [Chloroflexota bacterium]
MGVAAARLSAQSQPKVKQSQLWLRNRNWDLAFITMSVVLVPLPYLIYLIITNVTSIETDVARNVINGFVAIAIGGPHMMSTFLRTRFDKDFSTRYPMLIRSSIIIPIVVISLAFLNLNLLLTVFFFWAAMHVLHQVTYIVELYNHKEHHFVRKGSAVTLQARIIDYAVILTCLFPFAALKISTGSFDIGTNDLARVIPGFFQQTWFFVAMSAMFGAALLAFIAKSVQEYRGGYLNTPKTVFILLTIAVAFTIPALDNLDTAFQGLNTWHSFQYLAITFYIIKIRQQVGTLDKTAPLVARFSKGKNSTGLFILCTLMLVGSIAVFIITYALAHLVTPGTVDLSVPGALANWRFDVAYYTSILSFLWIHYYHDHFLFTNFEVLDDAYGSAKS